MKGNERNSIGGILMLLIVEMLIKIRRNTFLAELERRVKAQLLIVLASYPSLI